MALEFPNIDPVLMHLGPLPIRWYSLAYIAGILLGWKMAVYLSRKYAKLIDKPYLDDFVIWATIGIILGGRLGYVIFYNPSVYLADPLGVFEVWRGGMSFHGGLFGMILAAVLFCRNRRIPLFSLTDVLAMVAPIGLFFGRIANFINGELYGRISDVPWAMVFPHGGELPRHPSQLYQAGMEGLLLFLILFILSRSSRLLDRSGLASGLFLILYGIFRSIGEIFREPDVQLGFIINGLTMGQILSLPMIAAGGFIIYVANRRNFEERN